MFLEKIDLLNNFEWVPAEPSGQVWFWTLWEGGHLLSEAGGPKLNGGSSKLSAYFRGMEQPMLVREPAQLKSRFLDTMEDIFLFLFQQVTPSLFINLSLAETSCWGWLYCPYGGEWANPNCSRALEPLSFQQNVCHFRSMRHWRT